MEPIETDVPDLDSPAFASSIAHLYRGEMNRLTVWRQRLDVTSNWAIVLATGLATFTLGHPDVPHYTLLLGLALFSFSLFIEGRRYRHLHHSKWRVYLLQLGFFAEQLHPSPGHRAVPDWRRILAADLRHTRFLISVFTAVRVRLRRNYIMLLLFLTGVWIVKLVIHPARPDSLAALYSRLAIGDLIPPWFVAGSSISFIATAIVLSWTCPSAEQIENWSAHYRRVSQRSRES
ncbi:MAG: DUF2270 domain-containing protein [Thermoanaerobaculales bacterium]|jgi:uncharacterized membrane protein|nr:DUF2270 domain-containing protein [Thermoanaerobaculales bacterium]